MPTPYGTRGGMAFSADELRVLRRALALALHPGPATDQDLQDCLRLADSVREAVREGVRHRAFLLADLARYRQALPGTVTGYLELLADALATGYHPDPDDLAALRALRGNPTAAALLAHCQARAELAVRAKLTGRTVPESRTRLRALPGGRPDSGQAADADPKRPAPADRPDRGRPAPVRPVPTPAEVFPPRRPSAPEPTPERPAPPEKIAAG
ncbi:hypothetical protein ACX6XY_17035 [Streptomyces sp. O3]